MTPARISSARAVRVISTTRIAQTRASSSPCDRIAQIPRSAANAEMPNARSSLCTSVKEVSRNAAWYPRNIAMQSPAISVSFSLLRLTMERPPHLVVP